MPCSQRKSDVNKLRGFFGAPTKMDDDDYLRDLRARYGGGADHLHDAGPRPEARDPLPPPLQKEGGAATETAPATFIQNDDSDSTQNQSLMRREDTRPSYPQQPAKIPKPIFPESSSREPENIEFFGDIPTFVSGSDPASKGSPAIATGNLAEQSQANEPSASPRETITDAIEEELSDASASSLRPDLQAPDAQKHSSQGLPNRPNPSVGSNPDQVITLAKGKTPPYSREPNSIATTTTQKITGAAQSKGNSTTVHLQKEGRPLLDWTNSTNSTGGYTQGAIYPSNSILEDYVALAREQTEAADCFILGSILPVCGALLARRVYHDWGTSKIFPNVFVMLAGKPRDRESSIISLARQNAAAWLPPETFVPENFRPEALFGEDDPDRGGRPDKLLLIDDANLILTDWQKTANGMRNATRFLKLYDCGSLAENYRRNASENNPATRRMIPQTSTSDLFAATFNVACFQGQAVRAGLGRRLLYYVADRHGRLITHPKEVSIQPVVCPFDQLQRLSGALAFTPEAAKLWNDFQRDNRSRTNRTDHSKEAELTRLSSAPIQALSVAMIFQACVCAKQHLPLKLISENVLRCAIEHLDCNLEAAVFLDSIADQQTTRNDAELLLAKIRVDFRHEGGSIYVPRSALTTKYAHHSGRPGSC